MGRLARILKLGRTSMRLCAAAVATAIALGGVATIVAPAASAEELADGYFTIPIDSGVVITITDPAPNYYGPNFLTFAWGTTYEDQQYYKPCTYNNYPPCLGTYRTPRLKAGTKWTLEIGEGDGGTRLFGTDPPSFEVTKISATEYLYTRAVASRQTYSVRVKYDASVPDSYMPPGYTPPGTSTTPEPPVSTNQAPAFTAFPVGVQSWVPGKNTFIVEGADPDGDDVKMSWTALPMQPIKMECTPATSGKVAMTTCTLTRVDRFSFDSTVTFSLSDSRGGNTSRDFKVTGRSLLALGDSYTSGEGNPPFLPGTDAKSNLKNDAKGSCHRSAAAWPALLDASVPYFYAGSVACSGAQSSALTTGFKGEPAQLTAARALSPDPSVIVMSMGGNDVGFAYVVGGCGAKTGIPFTQQSQLCDAAVAYTNYQISRSLTGKIQGDMSAIHAQFPKAQIVLVGYPDVMSNEAGASARCPSLSVASRKAIGGMAVNLDSTLARSVQNIPYVKYVSTLRAFSGHELCSADPWVNPISIQNGSMFTQGLVYSAHPNARGHQAMSDVVAAYINRNLP